MRFDSAQRGRASQQPVLPVYRLWPWGSLQSDGSIPMPRTSLCDRGVNQSQSPVAHIDHTAHTAVWSQTRT